MLLSKIYKDKNNFDLIRFCLALFVLYSHSFILFSGRELSYMDGELFFNITNGQIDGGAFAVNMFFLISGFLITMSRSKSSNIYYFTIKRTLRIIPGLIGIFIFTILIAGPLLADDFLEYFYQIPWVSVFHDFVNMSISVTTMNNIFIDLPRDTINGSLWTLKYEVYCYLLVLLLGTLNLLNKTVITTLWIFFVGIYIAQLYFSLEISRSIPIPRLGTYFLLGALFFIYKEYIFFSGRMILLSLLLSIILIWFGFTNIAVLFFFPYLLFAMIYSSKYKFNNFAKYGDFSYGMYISAFFIQQLILYLYTDISFYIFVFLSFVFTLIYSILSWHFIEKPSLVFVHNKKIKQLFIPGLK